MEALEAVTRLLKAGKDPRRILDVLQIAVRADGAGDARPPSTSTCRITATSIRTRWAGSTTISTIRAGCGCCMSRRCSPTASAYHQQGLGEVHPSRVQGAERVPIALTAGQLLDRVDAAICALNGQESVGWTQAYCDNVADRAPLVQRIALAACKLGNDPHNQEIAQCMLMDYGTNRQPDRDRLLLAAAYHTAMHRKYGDPLEPARRFGQAMGFAELSELTGRPSMTISIRPIDPVSRPFFAGEVSGIDITQTAVSRGCRGDSSRAWINSACWCSTTSTSPTKRSWRSAATSASWNWPPATDLRPGTAAGWQRACQRHLQPRRRQPGAGARQPPAAVHPGQPAVALRRSFKAVPAKYSLLSARVIPSAGGNTEFADMRAAYDALDDETKAECEDLVCEHSQLYSRAHPGLHRLHR